jgi:DNA-binding NarL/FixJ family response regulator
LVPALRMAITGRKYVTPGVAALLAEHLDGTSRGLPHESLSRREFEVMQKLGAGHRVCDIAQQLGLSMKTVSTFRARMMRKLGMETHADLVRYLVQHDLLT